MSCISILFLFIIIGSLFSSDGFIIDSTLVDIGKSEVAPIFSLLFRCIVSLKIEHLLCLCWLKIARKLRVFS